MRVVQNTPSKRTDDLDGAQYDTMHHPHNIILFFSSTQYLVGFFPRINEHLFEDVTTKIAEKVNFPMN